MIETEKFDCVEFQRQIRLKNYLEANGNYDLMILNMKNRLHDNELYKYLIEKKNNENYNKNTST